MYRISLLLLALGGLTACGDPTPSPAGGARLGASATQSGGGTSVDDAHTLMGGVGSAAVVSTNPNGRLTAVIVD